jgi:hypothetical protein
MIAKKRIAAVIFFEAGEAHPKQFCVVSFSLECMTISYICRDESSANFKTWEVGLHG